VFRIGVEAGGTGNARNLAFATNAIERWYVGATTGHFLAWADNTYDIGASGATRPRVIHSGSGFSTAGYIEIATKAAITSASSGVMKISNAAETDFGRLQFGGTTSSFPALKRDATVLQARLADDSDFAPLQGRLRSNANATAEVVVATHTLRMFDAAGTEYKILAIAA
jgi:hypothetical protein